MVATFTLLVVWLKTIIQLQPCDFRNGLAVLKNDSSRLQAEKRQVLRGSVKIGKESTMIMSTRKSSVVSAL